MSALVADASIVGSAKADKDILTVTTSKVPRAESSTNSEKNAQVFDDGIERANANVTVSRAGNLFRWFDENDGPIERRLINKLDLYILSFSILGFWVSLEKYCDSEHSKKLTN